MVNLNKKFISEVGFEVRQLQGEVQGEVGVQGQNGKSLNRKVDYPRCTGRCWLFLDAVYSKREQGWRGNCVIGPFMCYFIVLDA